MCIALTHFTGVFYAIINLLMYQFNTNRYYIYLLLGAIFSLYRPRLHSVGYTIGITYMTKDISDKEKKHQISLYLFFRTSLNEYTIHVQPKLQVDRWSQKTKCKSPYLHFIANHGNMTTINPNLRIDNC